MIPSVGRVVHYMLSVKDAIEINRRRTDGRSIARRMANLHWHEGAQAHIGNPVREGDVLPMLIVTVDPPMDGEPEVSFVSGQVFLDGTDVFWARHRGQVVADSTDKRGCWFEPLRVAQVKLTPEFAAKAASVEVTEAKEGESP